MTDQTPEEPIARGASSAKRLFARLHFFGCVNWDGQIKALLHFVVTVVVLAAFNWMFARSDPGWLKLNPSPWALLPFYFGFRFGVGWGLGSGIALFLFRYSLAQFGGGHGPADHFAITGAEYFMLWGALLMGAVGGFARGVVRRREKQMEAGLDIAKSSNSKLRNQVALLKHNEQDLSVALVARGLDKSGITLNLQSIIQHHSPSDRDETFLNMLRDRCGVISAAIYFSARGGRAVRVALLKSDQSFPRTLEKTPMFEHAERTQKIVTQRWFWEPFEPNVTGSLDDRFLCVVAHPKGRDFRVLIVSRMRFEEIHWENFWKLESAFRWYENVLNGVHSDSLFLSEEEHHEPVLESQSVDLAPPPAKPEPVPSVVKIQPAPALRQPKPVLDAPGFKRRLVQCRQIARDTGLEHRLVVFVPGEGEPGDRCDAFVQSLSRVVLPSDDLAMIPSEGGRNVYGLITVAPSTEVAEAHAGKLLAELPDLDLKYFVLRLNDAALSAFEK